MPSSGSIFEIGSTYAMRLLSLRHNGLEKGTRVLLRVDFNVPLPKRGAITSVEDARIRASLPTIAALRKKGAKVILVSHLGRPDGKRKRSFSLAPVARHLATLLGAPVLFVADDIRKKGKAEKKLAALEEGGVALLENIRFYPEEEKNALPFAKRLASLADIFVSDAFAACHRAHASTVGVAKLLPSFAGELLEREVVQLDKAIKKPKRPFVVLLGGAKVSSKLPTLVHLLKVADLVLLGGGMANGFLRAKGLHTGKSEVDAADVRAARKLSANRRLRLPLDLLAADRLDAKAHLRVVRPDGVGSKEYVVDIGTDTVRSYAQEMKKAKTIVWNGPVGLFEVRRFSHGSVALGRVIAARSSGRAFGVVGGGETVSCLELTGMAEYVDHVSTGGGAMLEYLAGKKLPGIEVLKRSH